MSSSPSIGILRTYECGTDPRDGGPAATSSWASVQLVANLTHESEGVRS